ncbi:hypothetical protein [Methanoculleus chikugoensis]|uniref:hypothetical protein n=1 Tax=Methanoculleus chikugoensis TaxID=118126 RepID=UPI001FB4D4A5|nr:hypothetical protein [Methanoculleus chikugoensis]
MNVQASSTFRIRSLMFSTRLLKRSSLSRRASSARRPPSVMSSRMMVTPGAPSLKTVGGGT